MSTPYRILGFSVLPLLRWRIRKLSGLENLPTSGGFIVAANHQSWIDSGMMAAALYKNIPVSLRFIAQSSKYRFLGGIPIDEYDKSRVIDVANGYLKAGHSIVIFPEGNSNKNPELRSGKTGAARLALRSGAPVIPVGIRGTEGVKGWQALGWFFQFWKPCQITIGRPLEFTKKDLSTVSHEELMNVTGQIMERISHYSGKPYLVPENNRMQMKTSGWLRRFLRAIPVPMIGRRLKLSGLENIPEHGPYLVAANHSSYFDPMAVWVALYRERKIIPRFLTNGVQAERWRRIFGSGAWEELGMLPIDAQNPSQVLTLATEYLQQGGVVGIFPEGTRNKPKINPDWQTKMLPAKTGLARLLIQLHAQGINVPIIPAGIKAPAGVGFKQTMIGVISFWKPITVDFGPPIFISDWPSTEPSKEDLVRMMRPVMKQISALCGMEYSY